jgi:hypothetical protein
VGHWLKKTNQKPAEKIKQMLDYFENDAYTAFFIGRHSFKTLINKITGYWISYDVLLEITSSDRMKNKGLTGFCLPFAISVYNSSIVDNWFISKSTLKILFTYDDPRKFDRISF